MAAQALALPILWVPWSAVARWRIGRVFSRPFLLLDVAA